MTLRFINWIIRWFVQKIGIKTLIGITLLVIAVGSTAYGLADIIGGLESDYLFRLTFIGVFASWILARTRIRPWLAGVILLIVGVIIIYIVVGQLSDPLIALIKSSGFLVWDYFHQIPEMRIEQTSFNLAYSEVYFGIAQVSNALREWTVSLVVGPPLYDDYAVSMIWGMAMWLTASWSGWVFRRNNQPVISLFPAGLLLSITLSYTWAGTGPIVSMMTATLLLMALHNYDNNEKFWLLSKMDYPEDLPKEFTMTTVAVVIGIVGIATILPIFSIENLIETAQKFSKPQIEEAEPVIQSFGLEQGKVTGGDIGSALRGGFPRMHLMGSGPELAEQVVMTVKITGGTAKDGDDTINLPLYWRSLSYDDYFGYGWRSSEIVFRSYEAGDSAISPNSPFHRVIQQDFRMAKGESKFLYAAGDILTADDDYKIAYRITPRYTEIFNAHGDFFGASIDQSAYRVQSVIPVISENELQSVVGEFPDWIRDRYLNFPDTIPPRVRRLAQELTQNDPTPYDQTRTIEQYLRGFEYTLDVELPPLRRDMVDFFLFDLQKGYCDYYATAMVMMVRSLGIPARIAIGYYRGVYDDINDRYIVTEADAHSWVEVYFPEIGWVPFEPTAGREEIGRLVQDLAIPDGINNVERIRPLNPWIENIKSDWKLVSFVAVSIVITISLILTLVDYIRIRRLPIAEMISHLYQRLYSIGRRLKVAAKKEDTPFEFSKALENRIFELSAGTVFSNYLTASSEEIRDFTDTYIQMLYSQREITLSDRNRIISLWQNLRKRLYFAWVKQISFRKNK